MPQHLALPITVTGIGRLAAVEQDSDADLAQSVALLIDTRPEERRADPAYGVEDPVFGGVIVGDITDAIEEFEPRADTSYAEQVARGVIDQLVVHGDTTGPDVLEEA